MNAFTRFLTRRQDRDGAVPALETVATGLPALLVDAGAIPVPDEPTESGDRRRRALASPQNVLKDALSQKVLHGWLQNRHQTLLPLTVNFRGLGVAEAELLVGIMAAALLATAVSGADQRDAAEAFLKAAGASESTLATFRARLAQPEPLAALFDRVRAVNDLGPLAYVLIVVANDSHEPANQIFAQWAAVKLRLPATVVRSVERRYRH